MKRIFGFIFAIAALFSVSLFAARAKPGTHRALPGAVRFRLGRIDDFILPLAPTGPTDNESTRLKGIFEKYQIQARPASDLTLAMIAAQLADLEAYITNNSSSPYIPGLHVDLGEYYRSTGRYTKALEHWGSAWAATKGNSDGFGKELGDRVIAQYAQLLASLGRLEDLWPLFTEQKDRVLDLGLYSQIWARTREATAHMNQHPEVAYKCGVYAMYNVAQALTGQNYFSIALQPSPAVGFTMAQLADLATSEQLNLAVVHRDSGQQILAPSVVHWSQNHYAAIVAESSGQYLVVDPTFGAPVWMDADTINAEASGYFMISPNQIPAGWRWVAPPESSQVVGRGYPQVIDDSGGPKCKKCCDTNAPSGPAGTGDGSGSPCGSGMATWSVDEPNINLLLEDIPMFYNSAIGPKLVLDVSWHQRYTGQSGNTGHSHLPSGWNVDLTSYITAYPLLNHLTDAGSCVLVSGNGYLYTLSFDSGSSISHQDYLTGIWAVRSGSGSRITAIDVYYLNGAKEHYASQDSDTGWDMYLQSRADASGQALTFSYQVDGSGLYSYPYQLHTVTSADGATFTFNYASTSDYFLITGVSGPASSTVTFGFNVSGQLTSITDVVGMISSFGYDANGWVNSLKTPYGTTGFTHWDGGACAGVGAISCTGLDRAITVTEADGSHQMYVFYVNETGTEMPAIPTSFASSQIPSYPGGGDPPVQTLDTTRNRGNSHYWGRQPAAQLSTLTVGSLTAADYRLSRTYHRLGSYDGTTINTLSWELQPSANGTDESQPVFYDYASKDPSYPYVQGATSIIRPAVIAQSRFVNGTQTTWYEYFQRNVYGLKTTLTERWEDPPGTILYRTNSWTYASGTSDPTIDGLLVVQQMGPTNLLVHGYALDATYQSMYKYDTNAVSDVTTYTYDSYRRLLTKTSPAGLVSTYSYDATTKELSGIVDSISGTPIRTNSYTWSNGDMITHTDPWNLTATWTYDKLHRLTRTDYPDSTFEQFVYGVGAAFSGSSGGTNVLDLAAHQDRLGNWKTLGLNSVRQVTSVTNELGNIVTIAYCSCGNPSSVTALLGGGVQEVTSFSYDMQGNRTNIVHPDGSSFTNLYSSIGLLTNTLDSLSSTKYWNDGLNRQYAISNAFGLISKTTFDVYDRPVSQTDRNGTTVTKTYDALSRLLSAKNLGDSGIEYYGYTAGFALATAYTNQVGNAQLFAYDASQRKTNEVFVGVSTNNFTYYPADTLYTLTDGKNQTTSWGYDSYGRIISKTNADNVLRIKYSYDANGRMLTKWTSAFGTNTYSYDAVGNRTNQAYPHSSQVKLQYDALNRLTNMIDGVGTTAFSFTNGLLQSEIGPWSNSTVSYGYNTARLRNQLVLQLGASSTWTNTYLYDVSERLASVTSPAGSFTNSYSPGLNSITAASGLVIRTPYPGGSFVTNTFDSVGRIVDTTLYDNSANVLSRLGYRYNQAHQRTSIGRTNAIYTTWNGSLTNSYDEAGELLSAYTYNSSGGTVTGEQFGYGYDSAWNMTNRTPGSGSTTYGANNLNEVTSDSGANTTYSHDNNGNRTALNGSSNTEVYYAYDDENQLLSSATDTVYTPSANRWQTIFNYDGLGRLRIRKDYTWSTSWLLQNETHYIYDGMQIIEERNASNIPQLTYTRGSDLSGTLQGSGGIGGLLARSTHYSSSPYGVTSNAFYHADGNGNIVAMVNNTPALVASYKYDPFGRTLASGGSLSAANVMQFSSKMLIQTGLGYGPNIYYYGYRFYDPQTQRWLNKDPLGDPGSLAVASAAFAPWIDLASPNGATTDESMSVWTQVNRNLFGALGNNPISQIDPDGLFLGNIAMGLLGGGVDLGFQLLLNGGRWDCVSWTSVGISAVATGAGYGIGGTVAKLGKLGRAARVLEKAREKTGPLTNYMKGQVAQAMAARKAAAGGVAGFAASQAFKHAAKAAEKSLTDPPNGIGGNGKAPCP